MIRQRANDKGIVVGGAPRIDLLPPEIKQKKAARRNLRSLIALVALVGVLCVIGYLGATAVAVTSGVRLAIEQTRTLDLISAQGEYTKARTVDATVRAAKNARLVASAPEIIWREYLQGVQATLPEGASVTAIAIQAESADGIGPSDDGSAEEAAARVTLTGSFSSVESVALWQDSLVNLRGFRGVWITPITDAEGLYQIEATINVGPEAFEMRLFDPIEEPATDADAATESGS